MRLHRRWRTADRQQPHRKPDPRDRPWVSVWSSHLDFGRRRIQVFATQWYGSSLRIKDRQPLGHRSEAVMRLHRRWRTADRQQPHRKPDPRDRPWVSVWSSHLDFGRRRIQVFATQWYGSSLRIKDAGCVGTATGVSSACSTARESRSSRMACTSGVSCTPMAPIHSACVDRGTGTPARPRTLFVVQLLGHVLTDALERAATARRRAHRAIGFVADLAARQVAGQRLALGHLPLGRCQRLRAGLFDLDSERLHIHRRWPRAAGSPAQG